MSCGRLGATPCKLWGAGPSLWDTRKTAEVCLGGGPRGAGKEGARKRRQESRASGMWGTEALRVT